MLACCINMSLDKHKRLGVVEDHSVTSFRIPCPISTFLFGITAVSIICLTVPLRQLN